MTIKTSGALGMDEIAAEYNGTAPHSIQDYFGAPGLPASGALAFSDFYGKSDFYTTSRQTSLLTFDDTVDPGSWNTTWTTYYDTVVSTAYTTFWTSYDANKGINRSLARTTYRNTLRPTSNVTGYYEFITSFTTSYPTSWSAGNPS